MRRDVVMLACDHAAKPGEEAFNPIGVLAVFRIGDGVIYLLGLPSGV